LWQWRANHVLGPPFSSSFQKRFSSEKLVLDKKAILTSGYLNMITRKFSPPLQAFLKD
jgi:hypothetical protein